MQMQRNRLRNQFIGNRGKAVTQGSFKAAVRDVPLFISNVHLETSEKCIVEYIKNKTRIDIKLERIEMKKQRGYSAFKFFVPAEKVDMFLDDNLWPEGIAFRRFVRFKYRENERNASENVFNFHNNTIDG